MSRRSSSAWNPGPPSRAQATPAEDALPPLAPRRVRRQLVATRHAQQRARERGYRVSDFELVAQHGSPVHDGFILTARDVAQVEAECKALLDRLRRLVTVFVPVDGGAALSIYRPGAPKRRRRLEEAVC